jgi:hypothetical protein
MGGDSEDSISTPHDPTWLIVDDSSPDLTGLKK